MDNPLTRAEHEEFRRTVNAEIERLAAEDVRLSKRVEAVEDDAADNIGQVGIAWQGDSTDGIGYVLCTVSSKTYGSTKLS